MLDQTITVVAGINDTDDLTFLEDRIGVRDRDRDRDKESDDANEYDEPDEDDEDDDANEYNEDDEGDKDDEDDEYDKDLRDLSVDFGRDDKDLS